MSDEIRKAEQNEPAERELSAEELEQVGGGIIHYTPREYVPSKKSDENKGE